MLQVEYCRSPAPLYTFLGGRGGGLALSSPHQAPPPVIMILTSETSPGPPPFVGMLKGRFENGRVLVG